MPVWATIRFYLLSYLFPAYCSNLHLALLMIFLYYLSLMFINRFQAVKASIRRVHATLQPSRVQEYVSSSMRQYTVGDSQARIQK